ncbi:MAG TPA: HAMP domain-containing sensor histidine kinase [Bryobacteraceae bacterium]|jgi:signal transduction histidine kinase|nr:HAMP domain-containing sensor histidine kinase [Bryobacteraceae bacterium]
MIALLLRAGKVKILVATALLVALTALVDWAVGRNVSLALLYIVPMMLGAVVLRPAQILFLAGLCSYLRSLFDTPGSPAELALRFVFALLAYTVSGLLVSGLVRNHELVRSHLRGVQVEQKLRREAEEQLKILAESSPAAILTLDGNGTVLAANAAANGLFMIPSGETVQGRKIRHYLPVLADALKAEVTPGLRTAAQCQGSRENGEVFLAHMWFSLYDTTEGRRLAAIVVDSSEEMRAREEEGLRQLLTGNRIMATALSHEVRNFCGVLERLCESLSRTHNLAQDRDLQQIVNLIEGLESMASLKLQTKSQAVLEPVPLKEVLDNLRIVIEADWREIGGKVQWCLPAEIPQVLAEPHGLLQAFLNLVQNSHRAVQLEPLRILTVTVVAELKKVIVRFEDSGPGIPAPETLFQPFQTGASGSGLGLYVSRSIVRSYGGDLKFEPRPQGCAFAVELEAV